MAIRLELGLVRGDPSAARHRAPRAIESAAYFCCLEALQNATKHAGPGARITIQVGVRGGALRFRVCDDGAGFDPDALRPGYGRINLRDRIDAVGGQVEAVFGSRSS
jgi:signal transduction histidine kinase